MKKISKEMLKVILVLMIGIFMFSIFCNVKATEEEEEIEIEIEEEEEIDNSNLEGQCLKFKSTSGGNYIVRESADFKSDKVTSIPDGEVVEVIEAVENSEWLKIKFGDITGYIKYSTEKFMVCDNVEEEEEEVDETTVEDHTVAKAILPTTEEDDVEEKENTTSSSSSILSKITGTSSSLVNTAITFINSDTVQAIIAKIIEIVKSILTNFLPVVTSAIGL